MAGKVSISGCINTSCYFLLFTTSSRYRVSIPFPIPNLCRGRRLRLIPSNHKFHGLLHRPIRNIRHMRTFRSIPITPTYEVARPTDIKHIPLLIRHRERLSSHERSPLPIRVPKRTNRRHQHPYPLYGSSSRCPLTRKQYSR